MMKLIMEYCVCNEDDDKAADERADRLYRDIMGFAEMVNAFFLDKRDVCKSSSYVIVRVACGVLSHAVIRKHGKIKRAIKGWCKNLKNWVYDLCDDEDGGWDEFVVIIEYSFEDPVMEVRIYGKEDKGYSKALDGFSVMYLEKEL